MNNLEAYKMDGLGNDFIIFDKREKSISLSKEQIIKISDRNNIGCDQVIFIDKDKNSNIFLKFYNSDGGEIAACGNGSRCVAYILGKEKNKNKISLRTHERTIDAEIVGNLSVKINMGQPIFEWQKIPLSKKMDNKNIRINMDGHKFSGGFALNIGNPHMIFFVEDCFGFDLKKIGPMIENHEFFPDRCNVTFAQILDKKNIKVNVWERGAGQTKACGTAACATAVAASVKGLVDKNSNIHFKEGNLQIDCKEEVFMTGPISKVKKIMVDI